MKKEKKKDFSTIILVIIFLIGLCVLLYPLISNWYNSLGAERAVTNYEDVIKDIDDAKMQRILQSAENYNKNLFEDPKTLHNGEIEDIEYKELLDPTGTGMMGYITISKLSVNLPIYHGTTNEILNKYVGHLEGSSIPIGGESTHSILTGHRGLPSANLFTNLDKLDIGDTFILNILNQKLIYEVDDIKIVLPDEIDELKIVAGQDYVTLVTCTPYAVNTHRLLVRGHRIENSNTKIIPADAMQINSIIVAPIISIPILFILILVVIIKPKRRKRTHIKWSDIQNEKK